MTLESFFTLIKTIIVLLMFIFMANGILKYLNSYMMGKNRFIKIIERVAVNKNSALAIVKICDQYYLMSLSEDRNEILRELDKGELENFVGSMDKAVEGQNYAEMRKKIGEKISLFRNNNNLSDNPDTTDRIS